MEQILFANLPQFSGFGPEIAKHMDAYSWCVGYASSPRDYLYIGLIEQLRRLGDFTPEMLSEGIRAVRFGKTPTSFGQSAFLTYLFEFPNTSETLGLLYTATNLCARGARAEKFTDFLACDPDSHIPLQRRTFINELTTMSNSLTSTFCMMFDLELPLPCVDIIDRKRWPSTYWTRVDEFRQRFGLPKGTEFPCMCDCPVCSPEQWTSGSVESHLTNPN
jgi:hypothetical protein